MEKLWFRIRLWRESKRIRRAMRWRDYRREHG